MNYEDFRCEREEPKAEGTRKGDPEVQSTSNTPHRPRNTCRLCVTRLSKSSVALLLLGKIIRQIGLAGDMGYQNIVVTSGGIGDLDGAVIAGTISE